MKFTNNIASLVTGVFIIVLLVATPSFAAEGKRLCGHLYQGPLQDIMVMAELSTKNGNYDKNCKKMRTGIGEDLKNEIEVALGNAIQSKIEKSYLLKGSARKVARKQILEELENNSASISPNAGGNWTILGKASCKDVGNAVLGWQYDFCDDGMKASSIAQIIAHKCLSRSDADELLKSLSGDNNRIQRQENCKSQGEFYAVLHQVRLGQLENMTVGSVQNDIRKDVSNALKVTEKEFYKAGDQIKDTYDKAVGYVNNIFDMVECQLIVQAASMAIDGSTGAISSIIGEAMSAVPVKLEIGDVSKLTELVEPEILSLVQQDDFNDYLMLTERSVNDFLSLFKKGLICRNKNDIIKALGKFDARKIKAENRLFDPLIQKASYEIIPAASSSSGEYWQTFNISIGGGIKKINAAADFSIATNFKNDVVITLGPSAAVTPLGEDMGGGVDVGFGFFFDRTKSSFSGPGFSVGLGFPDDSDYLNRDNYSVAGNFSVQLDFSTDQQPVSGFTITRSTSVSFSEVDQASFQPYAGFSWSFPM